MEQIGIITKPQALKGEFRIKPNILNLKQFKKLQEVYISNKPYIVEKVTLRDTFVIMKIEGIDTCEQAESLRNTPVFALIEIDKNDNFDLVGFEVIVNNENVGVVYEINNYGSKDILSVKGDKSFMLPLIDDIIENIDSENKKLALKSNLFEQVVVYED